MFGLMGLFGAACILWGAGIYLRLFLRRPRYDDPLAYAQALSLSRTLDRRLEATSLRRVVWLKFYANMLLPFLGIAGGLLLGYVILSGAPPLPGAVVWMAAGGCALADLLFLRFYDRLSFCVNTAACLTLAAACFFAPPGGLFPRPPLWAAVAVSVLCACNLAYFWRRRALFSPAAGELSADGDNMFPAEEPEELPLPETTAFPRGIPGAAPTGQPVRERPVPTAWTEKEPVPAARTVPEGPVPAVFAAEEGPAPSATPAARLDWLLDRSAPPISGAAPRRDEPPRVRRLPPYPPNEWAPPAPVRAASSPWDAWEAPAFAETASPSIWRPSGSGEAAFPGGMPPAGARPQFTRRAFVTGSFLHGRQARLAVCVPGQAVIIHHLPDARFSDYMQVSAVVEDGPPIDVGNLGPEPSAILCPELPTGAACYGKILRVFPDGYGMLKCEIAY
ncbi:hypothetical protein D4A47_07455 [Anaerotruncus massiliensis (ex Liu et al. 2021)]|uniref:Uncharacterized protein n=2 Tax=Anaerotruncus TaxID=244127 RepID=A0A498CVB1_9FIRM|nr:MULTISPECIES: hypothetical protein [Anaerotruncus]MBC3938761.1 hypothetical protein [Anaerotruncus massiliensis (ex Togo et al. 2019)]RLL11447.1 hypothetical protein D4A47_07455 [Anaerotruncus massiliensis (ex Liu et al. 2021)]